MICNMAVRREKIKERSGARGFTLVELMIVIAIMAIMAAIAVPNFRAYMTQNRLNGAARMVMADLMYARSMAAMENVNFTVEFSGNSYSIIRTDTSEERRARNIQDEYFDVTRTTGNDVTFRPNGTVNAGTTVTLTNSRGSRTVTVSFPPGRVRINES